MKPDDSLVSIIIPVYNVERYLDACLESVVNQSYTSMEIILVDDGSTDNSGNKCDSWKEKDARIKVIHKRNEGLNYARKSGWEVATGEYITFLDSDDLFHTDNIKNTMSIMLKEQLDMLAYMFLEFSDKDEKDGHINPQLSDEYDTKETAAEAFKFLVRNGYDNIYPMTAWGKLYRKALVDKVNWQESNMRAYEDNFFTPQIFDRVKSFAVLKQQLYFYRRNDKGDVLSKMLTGNHRNGVPIGYLEYVNILKDYWKIFLDKHKVNIDRDMDDFWLGNMLFRLDNLLAAGLLHEEGNTNHIKEIIEGVQKKYEHDIVKQRSIINEQAHKIENLEHTAAKVESLESEIARLKTLRGAMRNAASSVKQNIVKTNK